MKLGLADILPLQKLEFCWECSNAAAAATLGRVGRENAAVPVP